MRTSWFHISVWMLLGVLAVIGADSASVSAQELTPGAGPYITVTYIEQVNVRSGPNSVWYPIVGHLQPGETAQATGVSPSHDWIQIVYPAAPGERGWVYVANITLSPGFLPVIEPPPTATPAVTATIDPTFAAQFNVQPTATRPPTFTPPPPLVIPTFTEAAPESGKFPFGGLITGIVVLGLLGLVFSFVARR